jgi:hypothetical protein
MHNFLHLLGFSHLEPSPTADEDGDHVKDFEEPTSNLTLHSGTEEEPMEQEDTLDVLAEAPPTQLTELPLQPSKTKIKIRIPQELKIIKTTRDSVELTVDDYATSAFREIGSQQQQRGEASGGPPILEGPESTMKTGDHTMDSKPPPLPESATPLEGRRVVSRASKPTAIFDGTSDSDMEVPMVAKKKKRRPRKVQPAKGTCAQSDQAKQKSAMRKRTATDGSEGSVNKKNTKVRKTNLRKLQHDRRPPKHTRKTDQSPSGGSMSDGEEAVFLLHCRSGPIGIAAREATIPESRHEIVHRACQARIKEGLIRGAIEFCQQVLIQWHMESMDILENLQECAGTDQSLTHRLIGLRNDIAGIWCTYTRVLLDVAYFLRDTRKSRSQHTIDDEKLLLFLDDKDQRENIILALMDEAIAVLGNVQKCPLVGNHYLISIGLSCLVDLEVSSTPSGHDLDQSCVGTTLATGVAISSILSLDFESMRELSSAFEKMVTHKFLFKDPGSLLLVEGELERIKARRVSESGKIRSRITPIQSAKMASTRLSLLPPLPADFALELQLSALRINHTRDGSNYRDETPTLVPSDSEERDMRPSGLNVNLTPIHEDSATEGCSESDQNTRTEMDTVNSTEGENIQFQLSAESSTLSTGTYTCYTDDVEVDREEGPGSNVYDVECFDEITKCWKKTENSYPCPPSLYVTSLKVNNDSEAADRPAVLVTDVEQICTGCRICTFTSHRDLHAHTRDCLKPLLAKRRNIAFGKTLLPRNWNLNSFDSEDGRGRALSVLIDVLDYSVELFEVKQNDPSCRDIDEVQSETKFTMHRPSFIGQVGLRCQYCLDKQGLATKGSFLFPDSMCNLSQAMWLLCMQHIDSCPNQPITIRSHHQEYRERLALDSGIVSDYWNEAADDVGLVAKKGRPGVVWRTSTSR